MPHPAVCGSTPLVNIAQFSKEISDAELPNGHCADDRTEQSMAEVLATMDFAFCPANSARPIFSTI
jgi:hypothetical protein